MLYKSGAQAVDQARKLYRQDQLERMHLCSHSTVGLGINSCRRSRPEAMYRALRIVTGSKSIVRAAQDGVQHLQTTSGFPGANASGSPPAIEVGLTTPPSSHKISISKVGHVT
jgi:hypothetical protein